MKWNQNAKIERVDDVTMQLQTKYVGNIEVAEDKVIHFPNGLPGFAEEKQFIVLDIPGNPIFLTLQSMMTPDLAFIVTNPYHFYANYEFKLDKNIQEQLQIHSEEDIHVLSIVTLKEPFATSTLNLKAPIIINDKQKLGKQYILLEEDYPTKAPLAEHAEQVEGE